VPGVTNLEHAFGLLLGRPLHEFDPTARYAVYHWDDAYCDEFFAEDEEVDLDAFARPETGESSTVADSGKPTLYLDRWRIDLGRTIFLVEDFEDLPVYDTLRAAAFDEKREAILGADFRRVLLAEEVDMDELVDQYATMLLRVQTDGTLVDAMRAATWTMSAPAGLVPRDPRAEVDPAWQPVLEQIDDPALRSHLEFLCLTPHWARSDGAYFLGAACPTDLEFLTTLPGHRALAGWEFGEGQAASVVLQFSG
jgi:hypothetical protein